MTGSGYPFGAMIRPTLHLPRVQLTQAACALVLLGCVSAGALSGASFTAETANPQSVSGAQLQITNSRAGENVISASGLKPGVSVSGQVTITSASDVPSTDTLTVADLVSVPASPALAAVLNLTVEDVTASPSSLYSGTLTAAGTVALGTTPALGARTYRLTLAWPAGQNNPALQGAQATMKLRWGARA